MTVYSATYYVIQKRQRIDYAHPWTEWEDDEHYEILPALDGIQENLVHKRHGADHYTEFRLLVRTTTEIDLEK